MPRKKRPCSDCGALREPGTGSLPDGALICRECRRRRGIGTNTRKAKSSLIDALLARYMDRRSNVYA